MNPGPSIEMPSKQSSFSKLDFIKIANSLGFKPTIFDNTKQILVEISPWLSSRGSSTVNFSFRVWISSKLLLLSFVTFKKISKI